MELQNCRDLIKDQETELAELRQSTDRKIEEVSSTNQSSGAPTSEVIRREAVKFMLSKRDYGRQIKSRVRSGVFIVTIKDPTLINSDGSPNYAALKQLLREDYRVIDTIRSVAPSGENLIQVKAKVLGGGDRFKRVHGLLRNRNERFGGRIGIRLSHDVGPSYDIFWKMWKENERIKGFGLSTGGNDQIKLNDDTFITLLAPENVVLLDPENITTENLKKLDGHDQKYFVAFGNIHPIPEDLRVKPRDQQQGTQEINRNRGDNDNPFGFQFQYNTRTTHAHNMANANPWDAMNPNSYAGNHQRANGGWNGAPGW